MNLLYLAAGAIVLSKLLKKQDAVLAPNETKISEKEIVDEMIENWMIEPTKVPTPAPQASPLIIPAPEYSIMPYTGDAEIAPAPLTVTQVTPPEYSIMPVDNSSNVVPDLKTTAIAETADGQEIYQQPEETSQTNLQDSTTSYYKAGEQRTTVLFGGQTMSGFTKTDFPVIRPAEFMELGKSDFTIEFDFRWTNYVWGKTQAWFQYGPDSSSPASMFLNTEGPHLWFSWGPVQLHLTYFAANVSDGAVHHLKIVRKNSGPVSYVTIYLDGQPLPYGKIGFGPNMTADYRPEYHFTIGQNRDVAYFGDQSFAGEISGFAISNG